MDKGDVKDHMAQIEVHEIHGNYEKNKLFVGSLGGQLMQLALAIQIISDFEAINGGGSAAQEPSKPVDPKQAHL